MSVPGANVITDISHYQTVNSWAKLKDSEIIAIIHKATEGTSYHDKTYYQHKEEALKHGFLWGSYHYSSGADPVEQIENYINYVKPEPSELICLDYEQSYTGPDMTYEEMIEFITEVKNWTGRYPVIYGGWRLRQATKGKKESVLINCPLWFARYSERPIGLPDPWDIWTLWQYTNGNVGPEPHLVQGIGCCDRDTFNGSLERLKEAWPLTHKAEEAVA